MNNNFYSMTYTPSLCSKNFIFIFIVLQLKKIIIALCAYTQPLMLTIHCFYIALLLLLYTLSLARLAKDTGLCLYNAIHQCTYYSDISPAFPNSYNLA